VFRVLRSLFPARPSLALRSFSEAGSFVSHPAFQGLHPMARTCALLTKTKGFPDAKKRAKKCLSAYGKRSKKNFEKVGF
jgi:hypothetical protein